MRKTKPITPENMDLFAKELIRLLNKYDMFSFVNIYVNNKWLTSSPTKKEEFTSHRIDDMDDLVYFCHKDDLDVTKQIEYCNPETVTITFEGPLYDEVNYGNAKILERMDKIAKKYGLYYELGFDWSLSFYKI